ncbi:MAG: flagellar basal-body MS-ring/collar protein FliF [Planctomycetota bacterium]
MKQLFAQLVEIWTGGTPAQRALGVLSALVVLLGIGGSIYLSTRPDYALLFGNLDPSDASQVVEEVRGAGVPAEVRGGGRDIFVPRQKISEMRMLVSAGGLPQGSGSGWELFDKSTFGVSDFVQNVTFRRALQGALARDIQSFDAVEKATVNITRPKRSAFLSNDQKPKASVIVKVRSGRSLSEENVLAIAHLISGAVEGLDSSDVKVMDSKMRLLSDEGSDGSVAAYGDKLQKLQLQEGENRRKQAQDQLDRMHIKADVRVAAEVEFQQIKQTTETVDPKGTVVEETVENRNSEPATSGIGGEVGTGAKIQDGLSLPSGGGLLSETDEKITSKYAFGKSVRSEDINTPRVKRLSVSLVVHTDHEDRLQEIEDLVKAAVMFDESRSDTLSSMVHEFEVGGGELPLDEDGGASMLPMLLERGVQIVGILGALFLLMKVLRAVDRKRPAVAEKSVDHVEHHRTAASPGSEHEHEPQVKEEPALVPGLEDLVRQSVASDPRAASRVLRTWISGGEVN